MTRILDRYIVKELGPPFAIGVGVFTFFLVIDRIYQLTDLVITKNVPFALVMPLLLYMLPAFLALTLPMATLVAVLLVCGRLAGDLEVAALKASGVSPLRLFRPFLAAGIVVTLLIAWLTLMVGPWSSGAFQRQLFRILQSRASTGIKERTFSATFNQFVIYVDEVSPSQVRLKGLLVSDERNPEQSRIIVAREGRLLSDEATRRITLRFLDGSISESDVGDRRRFRQTYFSLYDMSLPVDSPLTAASKEEKPEKQLPLRQLISEADRLYREGQIATPYYVELHKRFALPMAALMFTLVGFPLGIRSHRGGRAVALGFSFGIVVSYYILYTSMEGFALRGRLPAGHRGVGPQRDPGPGGPGDAARRGGRRLHRLARRVLAAVGQDRGAALRPGGQAARGAAPRAAGPADRAARVHVHHGPLPDPPVPDLPRHRHRDRTRCSSGWWTCCRPSTASCGSSLRSPPSWSTSSTACPASSTRACR